MKKRFGIHNGRTHWDDVMREIAIMEHTSAKTDIYYKYTSLLVCPTRV